MIVIVVVFDALNALLRIIYTTQNVSLVKKIAHPAVLAQCAQIANSGMIYTIQVVLIMCTIASLARLFQLYFVTQINVHKIIYLQHLRRYLNL